MLGWYQPLSTYHLPSAPILTVLIPNIPVSVAEKALDSLKQDHVSILPMWQSNLHQRGQLQEAKNTRRVLQAYWIVTNSTITILTCADTQKSVN
jgi:hypothetical protein